MCNSRGISWFLLEQSEGYCCHIIYQILSLGTILFLYDTKNYIIQRTGKEAKLLSISPEEPQSL